MRLGLPQLPQFLDAQTDSQTINLSRIAHIDIASAVAVCCLSQKADKTIPPTNGAVADFLEMAGTRAVVSPNESWSTTSRYLATVTLPDGTQANLLPRTLVPVLNMGFEQDWLTKHMQQVVESGLALLGQAEVSKEAFHAGVGELCQNAREHSGVESSFVSVHLVGGYLTVAVGDDGVGIPAKLDGHADFSTDAECLELVLQDGASSKEKGGLGLVGLGRLVTETTADSRPGRITLLSGCGYATKNGAAPVRSMTVGGPWSGFPGTLAVISLPVE